MKYIPILLTVILNLLLGNIYAVEGLDEKLLKLEIARLLEYPPNRLLIEDITKQSRDQNLKSQRPIAIEAKVVFRLESKEGDFYPMTIAVSSLGIPMLEEIEQATKTETGKLATPPFGKKLLHQVKLTNDGYAYIIPLVGPGGSQTLVLARMPSMNMDVAISIITGRGKMDSLKGNVPSETEAYHHLISEGGERLTERLIKCAEAIIAKVTQTSPPSVQQTPVQPIPPSASSVVSEDNSTPSLESSDPRPSPAVKAEPSKSTPWPWIIGAILLVAIAGGILLKLRCK